MEHRLTDEFQNRTGGLTENERGSNSRLSMNESRALNQGNYWANHVSTAANQWCAERLTSSAC